MIDWTALPERMNQDPEFQLAGREWNTKLRLDVGERSHLLDIENGRVQGIRETDAGTAAELFIRAPEADWKELLAETPRPFYQDLTGASIHHGVELPHDQLSYAAYYPALRRLVQLMRDLAMEAN